MTKVITGFGSGLGPLLDEAMRAQTEADARRCLQAIIECLAKHHAKPIDELEALARENIGYWAGYSDTAVRARVEPLYKCEHPIFGSIAEYGAPSAELALKAGVMMANARRGPERDAVIQEIRQMMRRERDNKRADHD